MTHTLVIRIDDDRACPLVGEILGHDDDDERVWVAWGDSRYSEDKWSQARIEYADQLAPTRRTPTHV